MSENESLVRSVFNMVQAVRAGEIDPLDLKLTQAYKDLQELVAKIDNRIDIDEMLNEILGNKVNRVQELARILAAPEVYVSRLKQLSMRDLAKLMKPEQPVVIGHLEHHSLEDSLNRIVTLIDAMAREPTKDSVPSIASLPNGYALDTEDSVFLDDLEEFLGTIPEGEKIGFDDLIMSDEFDIFLRRFLYVVILVSKGRLHYDSVSRVVWKPLVSEIDTT